MQDNTKSVAVKMTARRCFRTEPIWQYDVGHVLTFEGFELPAAFEVHFARSPLGKAITQIGTDGTCTLPDMFAQTAGVIYAWLYIADADSGLTKYSIEIPVAKRAQITDQEPTPVEQSAIDQAIAALNAGVEAAEDAQEAAEAAQASAESYAESAGQSAITATNAANSATSAKTAAETAARNAAASATDAHTSREAADQSATNAGISERAAASSASAAAGSATSAAASAGQASASATAASGSASTASTKASEAAQSATAAAGSAASASEAAGTASTAVTAAEASATAAAGSATAAAGSATSAGQSATAAAGSAQAAQDVLDSIPADYSELSGDVDTLKSALQASNIGKEYLNLYSAFVHGAIVNGVLYPSHTYRVSSASTMSFDRDITLNIASGFRIGVFYFVDGTYSSNSGFVTDSYKIPKNTTFSIEISKTPEVIVEANITEFVQAVTFSSIVWEAADNYNNELAQVLEADATYSGYFKLNSTALTSSNDLYTKKYVIPTGTTKVFIKTRFSGLVGVAFSDITDPTVDYLGYPKNCTKDPTTAYVSLTDHVKTYTLDRYYKCVYIPYYVPWGEPTVIAYRESAFDTFWEGIHPLEGKNVLTFGDSITYTSARWRDEFYRITRAKEIACISNVGAHLTDYNNTTPLDGNYMSTADGGVHNVVCNQVYYWLTNMPSEIEPDIIIISAGTNDTQSIAQLETDINVYTDSSGWLDVDTIERTSFEGAMRWITSKLRAVYPYAVIVFASPIQSAQAIHAMEYQLAKEAKMEKVCKRLSANLIKATSESGITGEFEVNNGVGRYLNDGLHPNELGGIVLGTYYANVLEDIFKTLPRH